MEKENQTEPQLFISDVDHDTRNNILSLDQKLRGLSAEIEAKLLHSSQYDGENKTEYLHSLTVLQTEVNQAIGGIAILVNLVMTDDHELADAFIQSKEMKQFNKMLADNLLKITKIKEKF